VCNGEGGGESIRKLLVQRSIRGLASEVMPSFFIITFCAWTTGFVARWRDFLASLSLRLMKKDCGGR